MLLYVMLAISAKFGTVMYVCDRMNVYVVVAFCCCALSLFYEVIVFVAINV